MTAVVTGAGRGIGRAIAVRLSHDGWDVALTARSVGELTETAALCRGRTAIVAGDIAAPEFVKILAQKVETALNPIDLLVNNAGAPGPLGPFWENDPAEWWRCLEVNLRGPMLCCREFLIGMMARRTGRIINVVSGAASQPFADMSAYVASKTALMRLTEQLALELGPYGIKAFSIRPGFVRTRMVEEARGRLSLIQRMLDEHMENGPEAPADLVAILASGRADALNGRLCSVEEDIEAIIRRANAR
ncbi:MAG TPA: SDR family oxidoreductase [Bryobacteraceae bacterium]|nr:SDR family oxidoreductase [Bryobacteraceae bacterium]